MLERSLEQVDSRLADPGPKIVQTVRSPSSSLALLAGWFSFPGGGATFGDTESLRVATLWLDRAGIPYDIAAHPSSSLIGLDFDRLDPRPYTHFLFVCGPWGASRHNKLLDRFRHCRTVGVGLSIEKDHHEFDAILPRDFQGTVNPDLAFASEIPSLPVAGVILASRQRQYKERQRHERVEKILEQYLHQNEVVPIYLDTSHSNNKAGVATAFQFEHLIGKMDVVISTRLHGMIFALKRGTPVVAIDAVAGGAKVAAQAKALGWPVVLSGDDLTEESLAAAVRLCLSGTLAGTIGTVQTNALERLAAMEGEFIDMVRADPSKAGR